MFSQKLRNVDDDELRIEIDPCYEADPYELKLDEMFDAEPEPEIIEGLPASDALTLPIAIWNCSLTSRSREFSPIAKPSPTARRSRTRWIF